MKKAPKAKVIKFYTDPGHGWAAAKYTELDALGIADKITPYSYRHGNTVYLEEDCDFTTYTKALIKSGVQFRIETRHFEGTHRIRYYDSYKNNCENV